MLYLGGLNDNILLVAFDINNWLLFIIGGREIVFSTLNPPLITEWVGVRDGDNILPSFWALKEMIFI